jgi:hypothetical protein
LDKLKGIKADLERGNEGWQEWSFDDLLKELKKCKDINTIEEKSERRDQLKGGKGSRSKFFHAKDSARDTRERGCVYCEDTTHKSTNCPKVVTREQRKKFWRKRDYASIAQEVNIVLSTVKANSDVRNVTRNTILQFVNNQNNF